MLELDLKKAELKTINGHRYYVFPMPPTHENPVNRPTKNADEKVLKTYTGKGTNKREKLHPDVLDAVNQLMTAFLEYGTAIDDYSITSAIVASGWRPDDANQGANYLRIIKNTIAKHQDVFKNTIAGHKDFSKSLEFPTNLEADAQSELGRPGDPRRTAFRQKLAASDGWNGTLVYKLFNDPEFGVDRFYAPRGSNPHASGFVFDLDFSIYCDGKENECPTKNKPCYRTAGEYKVGANPILNRYALRSAAGMWLNTHSMFYGFDSYDTKAEIWHMEFRK
jgi:hypothetical protein